MGAAADALDFDFWFNSERWVVLFNSSAIESSDCDCQRGRRKWTRIADPAIVGDAKIAGSWQGQPEVDTWVGNPFRLPSISGECMVCDKSFDSGQQKMFWCDMSSSIAFDNVSANDRVIIRTKNSLYRFSVNDPAQRQGLLSGGRLGDSPRNAVLIESLVEDGSRVGGSPSVLKVGSRALFYLLTPRGVERVITSVITDLTLLKDDQDAISVS
jgi:hypothetical protein